MHSEQINEIGVALAKAQGQMKPASRDATNPHLGAKYATLSSIIEAARKPLSDNGLAFTQLFTSDSGTFYLETLLIHSSGQWLSSVAEIGNPEGNRGTNKLQSLGSALTYTKRYQLSSLLGISSVDDDDDGAGAAGGNVERPKSNPQSNRKTNGKEYKINSPDGLLEVVNLPSKADGYYNNIHHLMNGVRKAVGDEKWTWPSDHDLDGWKVAGKRAVDHAKASQQASMFADAPPTNQGQGAFDTEG